MPRPRNKDVDLALLLELVRAGRPMRPGETDAMVTRHFPDLSESDMAITRSDGRTNAFQNSIRWARAHLRVRGLLVDQTGLWQVNAAARSALNEDLVGRGMSQLAATAFISSTQVLPDALGRGWSSPVRYRARVTETTNSRQPKVAKQPKVAPTRRWSAQGTLGDCTGAFRSSEGIISLLVPVDTELLRGSGRSIDGPVAAAIGVTAGSPRRLLARARSPKNLMAYVGWLRAFTGISPRSGG